MLPVQYQCWWRDHRKDQMSSSGSLRVGIRISICQNKLPDPASLADDQDIQGCRAEFDRKKKEVGEKQGR